MKRIALLALLLLNFSTLFAQYGAGRTLISEEGAKNGLIATIIIFSIVFGSAIILYIKQRMDEE